MKAKVTFFLNNIITHQRQKPGFDMSHIHVCVFMLEGFLGEILRIISDIWNKLIVFWMEIITFSLKSILVKCVSF